MLFRTAMGSDRRWAAVLMGAGVGVFGFVLWLVIQRPPSPEVPATGAIGVLEVYGQLPQGPVRLQPDRRRTLPRPQYIAFVLNAEGTGPRLVRVDLEVNGVRQVVHEETIVAPASSYGLDYVLRLDDSAADELAVVVSVESPHAGHAESRFMVRLGGREASAPK